MVAWSAILLNNVTKTFRARSFFCRAVKERPFIIKNYVPIRCYASEERTIIIRETQYSGAQFKNLLSLYFIIGMTPIILCALYTNIYIGPAKLALIPEDYEPKHWEYYEHPISRFLARYILRSPQEQHERNLHILYKEKESQLINIVKKKVDLLMDERRDYQSWYFTQPMAKYARHHKELTDEHYEAYHGKSMSSVDY